MIDLFLRVVGHSSTRACHAIRKWLKSVTIEDMTCCDSATFSEISRYSCAQRCKAFFAASGSYGIFRPNSNLCQNKNVFISELAEPLLFILCFHIPVLIITESICEVRPSFYSCRIALRVVNSPLTQQQSFFLDLQNSSLAEIILVKCVTFKSEHTEAPAARSIQKYKAA